MKIEIKNQTYYPNSIRPLFNYFESINPNSNWEYKGMIVELDPTIDFKANDALIRWLDVNEGFNDKIIVNSLEEFKSNFKLINA
jgi:hypothetical protein